MPRAAEYFVVRELDALERLPLLLAVPARVRFVSVEPMLEPVDLSPWLHRLHWIIYGGESGNGARPCSPDWIRAGIRQCRDGAVPLFVKQLGKRPEDERDGKRLPLNLTHAKGADPAEWPEDLRVREWPAT
jgi:protein gp37